MFIIWYFGNLSTAKKSLFLWLFCAFSGLLLIVHVEVFHGVDPDVIYDEAPYLCFWDNIRLLHEILMLCGCEGATLQHIPNLLADSVIVLSRQSVPKLLLWGFQFPFHSVVFTVPKPGRSEHRFTCREVWSSKNSVNRDWDIPLYHMQSHTILEHL